jgi:hypothetical protein
MFKSQGMRVPNYEIYHQYRFQDKHIHMVENLFINAGIM